MLLRLYLAPLLLAISILAQDTTTEEPVDSTLSPIDGPSETPVPTDSLTTSNLGPETSTTDSNSESTPASTLKISSLSFQSSPSTSGISSTVAPSSRTTSGASTTTPNSSVTTGAASSKTSKGGAAMLRVAVPSIIGMSQGVIWATLFGFVGLLLGVVFV